MSNIKFDGTLNWSTIISALTVVVAVIGFGFNVRSGQKVQAAQVAGLAKDIDDVKDQLGELRRMHLAMAGTVQVQAQSLESVSKVAKINSKSIQETKNNLPHAVAAIVKSQAPILVVPPMVIGNTVGPEDLKKKLP